MLVVDTPAIQQSIARSFDII
uniref:Uncharacterized protein n=1 Tax=Anguilla anguilla TaxID=7936 RepID=A0A0E9V3E3_ANGAN